MNRFFYKNHYSIYFLFLIGIFFIFKFQYVIFEGPFGTHYIRQTDSLSFVSNYYHFGFRFFEPEVFNLGSIDGKNACEFPIVYYFVALLYLIFGEHDFILRILTYSISLIGFLYVYKISLLIINKITVSFLLSLILISSPILNYYTINFLPDAIVLALTIIGLFYFLDFLKNNNSKSKPKAFLFFGIASLIKITYFIYPLAAICTLLFLNFITLKTLKATFKAVSKELLYFSIILFLIILWTLFINYYNEKFNATYFTIKPLPIWDLSVIQINEVKKYILNHWFSDYYYPSTNHFIFLLVILFILKIKSHFFPFIVFLFIVLLGLTVFFILFFQQFKHHDYYFLIFFPFLILLILISVNQLVLLLDNKKYEKIIIVVFSLFLILSFKHTRLKILERYDKQRSDLFADIGKKLNKTPYLLKRININKNAKFIIYSDLTPNGALYTIKRKGWNIMDSSALQKEILNNLIVSKKADYILSVKNKLINPKFETIFMGNENGNYIYKLK